MKQVSPIAIIATAGILITVTACRQGSSQTPPPVSTSLEASRGSDAPRSIVALYPLKARVGEPFQKQPDGNSAISVTGNGFTTKDVIFWDGKPLQTVYGNPTWITAEVPSDLLTRPKQVEISVRNQSEPESRALRANFELLPEKVSR